MPLVELFAQAPNNLLVAVVVQVAPLETRFYIYLVAAYAREEYPAMYFHSDLSQVLY